MNWTLIIFHGESRCTAFAFCSVEIARNIAYAAFHEKSIALSTAASYPSAESQIAVDSVVKISNSSINCLLESLPIWSSIQRMKTPKKSDLESVADSKSIQRTNPPKLPKLSRESDLDSVPWLQSTISPPFSYPLSPPISHPSRRVIDHNCSWTTSTTPHQMKDHIKVLC